MFMISLVACVAVFHAGIRLLRHIHSRVELANLFSAIDSEIIIIRVCLNDYYLKHGQYPAELDMSIQYHGQEYALRYREKYLYSTYDNKKGCIIKWIAPHTGESMQVTCESGIGSDRIVPR